MNHVTLIGRLTKDPVSKKTQTGKHVANFILAVNRISSGQNKEVDYIQCVAWEKTADVVQKYVHKGSQIAIEGRISTRNYDDANGKKVYVTEVIATNVYLLEKASSKEVDREPYYPKPNVPETNQDFDTGPSVDISSDDLPF